MKVVVAIDQSETAWDVLGSVIQTAWPAGTAIKIVSVVEATQQHLSQDAKLFLVDQSRPFRSEEQLVCLEQAREILALARMAVSNGLPNCVVHTELREGEPGDEVVLAACEWMADKIVVGSHSGDACMVLRPVPYAVLQYSSCCVRLVRLKPKGSLGQSVTSLLGVIAKKWA